MTLRSTIPSNRLEKPWKTDGKACADGVEYDKGIHLFEARYFKFSHSQEADGMRVYTLMDGPGSALMMQVGCVVRGMGDIAFAKLQRNLEKIDANLCYGKESREREARKKGREKEGREKERKENEGREKEVGERKEGK